MLTCLRYDERCLHTTEDSGAGAGLHNPAAGSSGTAGMRIISGPRKAEAYSSGGQAPCTLGAGHARALTLAYGGVPVYYSLKPF